MRLLELGFQIQAAGAGLESGARGAEAMMRFKRW